MIIQHDRTNKPRLKGHRLKTYHKLVNNHSCRLISLLSEKGPVDTGGQDDPDDREVFCWTDKRGCLQSKAGLLEGRRGPGASL